MAVVIRRMKLDTYIFGNIIHH